jgi:arsenate reductase-like glutaredoxin family protein
MRRMSIAVYHTPACSTSSNVLALIRESRAGGVFRYSITAGSAREALRDLL